MFFKVLRVQWIGNWKPEFKFHPLWLAFYVAMVTSMTSLAQFSLPWNGGVTSEIHLHSALWKHLWSLEKCYLCVKDERTLIWSEKNTFYLFITFCLSTLCVYTHVLFGLLSAALCDPTVCSVSDSVVVESKFSAQTGVCELNSHHVKHSCV